MIESSKDLPELSDEATEVLWSAAQAANLAWDDWKSVEQCLLKDPATDNYNSAIQISEAARDAAFNYKLLSDFAGLAMKMPNCPFIIEHRETIDKTDTVPSSEDDDVPF